MERLSGEGGHRTPACLVAQNWQRTGTNEGFAKSQWCLRLAAKSRCEIEDRGAAISAENDSLGDGQALFLHDHLADVDDLARKRDTGRADRLARVARET